MPPKMAILTRLFAASCPAIRYYHFAEAADFDVSIGKKW